MPPLKIWHWNEGYTPKIGGGEILLSRLAQAQQAQGHEVHVLTNLLRDTDVYEEVEGIAVTRLPFYRMISDRNLAGLIKLQAEVRRQADAYRPDIIHLHSPRSVAFCFLRLPKEFFGACAYTAHDGTLPKKGKDSTLLRQVMDRVDRVTVPSFFTAEHYKDCFPEFSPKISSIYNSLPPPLDEPVGLALEPPHVLAYGRLVREKGFDLFLDAASRLRSVNPEWRYTLAGDGLEKDALQQQAERLGLSDVVHFPGWVAPQGIPGLLDSCSLVVVPSRWQEPFGLTALQAMQRARPVVTTQVGGLPEVVAHGETGLVVPPDNSAALADAINELISDPPRLQALGTAARARAKSTFSWSSCVDAYEAVYAGVMA